MSRIQMKYLVDQETCRWWYGFQLSTSDIMLLSLETLLMVRSKFLHLRIVPSIPELGLSIHKSSPSMVVGSPSLSF